MRHTYYRGGVLVVRTFCCALLFFLFEGAYIADVGAQPLFPGPRQTEMADYANILRREIHLRVREARYLSISGGVVTYQIKIDKSGKIVELSLLRLSGDPHIDRAAMKVLGAGIQFPPFPSTIKSSSMDVSFPVRFPPR
ncbi:energy transducer TonB family protein [Methylorubrum extorquens]